MKHFTRWFSF